MASLMTVGIENIPDHFLPRRHTWFHDRMTWIMVRAGREVWSRTDYILGMYSRLFGNMDFQEPRHNSDH